VHPLWQHTSQTLTDCIQYALAVCPIVQHHDQHLGWRLDDCLDETLRKICLTYASDPANHRAYRFRQALRHWIDWSAQHYRRARGNRERLHSVVQQPPSANAAGKPIIDKASGTANLVGCRKQRGRRQLAVGSGFGKRISTACLFVSFGMVRMPLQNKNGHNTWQSTNH